MQIKKKEEAEEKQNSVCVNRQFDCVSTVDAPEVFGGTGRV